MNRVKDDAMPTDETGESAESSRRDRVRGGSDDGAVASEPVRRISSGSHGTSDSRTTKQLIAALHATFRSGRTRPLAWRRSQLKAMTRMLRENTGEICEAVRADMGKPVVETRLMEVNLVLEEIRFILPRLARWAARRPVPMHWLLQPAAGWTVAEPKGVALVISPWNYPVLLSLEPMADAIAAGDCVCLKPSELSPRTSAVLAKLVERYLAPEAFAVIQGGPDVAADVLRQPFDHVFYTGSGRVGSIVMTAAARRLTPVTLELGGKSPVFVDGSADLRVAARRIVWGRFINAGQTCVAPDYVLVTSDVAEAFIRLLAGAVTRMFGRDPSRSPSYGRIVDARHVDRLMELMPDPSDPSTGRVVCGGDGDRDALYVAPTVIADASPDAPVMREEIFGPLLPVLVVRDAAEAVRFIGSRPRPLAAYVFTRSGAVRRLFETRVSSGALGVNLPLGHLMSSRLPFGGLGGSGMGAYHGRRGFEEFSHRRSVVVKPCRPDTLSFVYPPYGWLAGTIGGMLCRPGATYARRRDVNR